MGRSGVFAERDLWIDAEVRRVREARDWAAGAAREFGFTEADCYQVRLAVSEVVANAVQHGSRAPADPIRVSIRAEGGGLVFEVADTGRFLQGDPPQADMSEHGRGLELVAMLMDSVEVEAGDNGTLLRLTKRRDDRVRPHGGARR